MPFLHYNNDIGMRTLFYLKVAFIFTVFLFMHGFLAAQKTIKVDNQIWMGRNLSVSKFRNGDAIPEAKTKEEWERAGASQQPAWCYYDNNPKNKKQFGKLYNWYAVNDSRGLAPEGWRIPDENDWRQLITYLYSESIKTNNKNEFILSLPKGGSINSFGQFDYGGIIGFWWSASRYISSMSWYMRLSQTDNNLHADYTNISEGYSVRCIKK